MATQNRSSGPRYFQWFPDIQYALRSNKAGRHEYIKIKDYFHLMKVRDDIFREDTLYSPYSIKNGQRPDQISYDIYGDEQFYWVILQINNIVNYYEEWPLEQDELEAYVYKKYGGVAAAGETHHWETYKVEDAATPPNVMLEGGLVVPEDFIFYYPDVPGSTTTLSEARPFAVSNMTYERRLNDVKSQIYILDKKYIYDYAREVKTYAQNLDPSISFADGTQFDFLSLNY